VPVVRTVRLDGGQPQFFPETWGARDPTFAPDGKSILFVLHGYLYLIHPDGTHLTRVANSHGAFSASFSPDGRRIALVKYGANVYVLRLRDHSLRRLTYDTFQARAIAFSPSGKRIVFSRTATEQNDQAMVGTWVIRADGTHEHRIRDEVLLSLDWQPL
jgi:Tol biopolymer transport system component